MELKTNENGQILVDMSDVVEQLKNYSRYNGGWVKSVTGLNKEHANGFSLVGEFCSKKTEWTTPGLFVDCSISGSRKNQEKTYTLFRLNADGTVREVQTTKGSDWAINLWDSIESELNAVTVPDVTALETERAALLARLAEIDEILGISPTDAHTVSKKRQKKPRAVSAFQVLLTQF